MSLRSDQSESCSGPEFSSWIGSQVEMINPHVSPGLTSDNLMERGWKLQLEFMDRCTATEDQTEGLITRVHRLEQLIGELLGRDAWLIERVDLLSKASRVTGIASELVSSHDDFEAPPLAFRPGLALVVDDEAKVP